MQKTTRAFRTISEAGDELDLQPHVLRFWESKFPQIKPIKRGGGRRFYRPEDIEFLRGIKILLHNEKHPIKDVQKLIRVKGPQRVIELGQSVERASQDRDIVDTVLIPKRIIESRQRKAQLSATSNDTAKAPNDISDVIAKSDRVLPFTSIERSEAPKQAAVTASEPSSPVAVSGQLGSDKTETPVNADTRADTSMVLKDEVDLSELEAALDRLLGLRRQWQAFSADSER